MKRSLNLTIRLFALLGVLVLSLTACFQSTEEAAQGQAESVAWLATLEASPSPTSETSQALAVSPAPSAEAFVPVQDNSRVVLMSDAQPLVPQGTAVAQAAEADVWSLTATAYIGLITQTQVISLTQTAQALGIGVTPTSLPTLEPITPTPQTIFPTQPGVFPTQGQVVPGGTCVHEVRLGDNLFRLSMYYGLPIATIASANGITNIQVIVVGQKLTIPGCGTTGNFPPPTSIAVASSTFGIGGPVTPTFTNVCGPSYTVQQYETLFIISQRCGVPVASIAAANGIVNINMIMIGQVLNLPSQ